MEAEGKFLTVSGYICQISADKGRDGKQIVIDTTHGIFSQGLEDSMWQLAISAITNEFKVLVHYDCEIVEKYEKFSYYIPVSLTDSR